MKARKNIPATTLMFIETNGRNSSDTKVQNPNGMM